MVNRLSAQKWAERFAAQAATRWRGLEWFALVPLEVIREWYRLQRLLGLVILPIVVASVMLFGDPSGERNAFDLLVAGTVYLMVVQAKLMILLLAAKLVRRLRGLVYLAAVLLQIDQFCGEVGVRRGAWRHVWQLTDLDRAPRLCDLDAYTRFVYLALVSMGEGEALPDGLHAQMAALLERVRAQFMDVGRFLEDPSMERVAIDAKDANALEEMTRRYDDWRVFTDAQHGDYRATSVRIAPEDIGGSSEGAHLSSVWPWGHARKRS